MYDVFISYSHKDKRYADAICHHLEEGKVRCWYAPRNIQFGDPWAESITKAIQNSSIFVIIVSKKSMSSNQVYKEMNLAKEHHLKIITFKISSVKLTKDINSLLVNGHWLDSMNRMLYSSLVDLHKEVCKYLQIDYHKVKRKIGFVESLKQGLHNIRAVFINLRSNFKLVISDIMEGELFWTLRFIVILVALIAVGECLWRAANLVLTNWLYGIWI